MEGGRPEFDYENSAIGLISHPDQRHLLNLLGERANALFYELLATDKRQESDSKNG